MINTKCIPYISIWRKDAVKKYFFNNCREKKTLWKTKWQNKKQLRSRVLFRVETFKKLNLWSWISLNLYKSSVCTFIYELWEEYLWNNLKSRLWLLSAGALSHCCLTVNLLLLIESEYFTIIVDTLWRLWCYCFYFFSFKSYLVVWRSTKQKSTFI